jgi:transcription elongation factor GreA
MQMPKRKSEILRQSKEEAPDRYMTAEAIERLKRTIECLEKEERPVVLEEVKTAREMGDLSENAGYQESKARLRSIDNRLLGLKEKVKWAIPIQASDDGTVQIGSTVTVLINGSMKTFQILGSTESNPAQGRISHRSPIGARLIGQKAGDVVTLQGPAGEVRYEIVEVK